MSDKIPVTFPTAGALPARSRNRGEKFPVVFTIPKGVLAGGKHIGSMKTRVDVGSRAAYDPNEPLCRAFIDAGETELFAIGSDRRSKTTVRVDSAELAAALEDWTASGPRPATEAPRPAAKERYVDRGDFETRCKAAERAAALRAAERAAKKRR